MSALVLDGRKISEQIRHELQPRIGKLIERFRPPGLAVVLVGHNPASEIYVRNKVKACEELGIRSFQNTPPDSITTEELLGIVHELNGNPDVDGILVQMPLPPQVDTQRILQAVEPAKDADGFHPFNVGNLVANRPGPRPCTPVGIMEMLRRYEIPLIGKRAVIVGRSEIVGKPMSMLLLNQSATVTICHSRTDNLAEECSRADLLVAALGKPGLLGERYIKPGAIVVDVGINRVTDKSFATKLYAHDPSRMALFEKNGSVVVGDVDPLAAINKAGAYTPVPGGVGPLTIAMLMSNTVMLTEAHAG